MKTFFVAECSNKYALNLLSCHFSSVCQIYLRQIQRSALSFKLLMLCSFCCVTGDVVVIEKWQC